MTGLGPGIHDIPVQDYHADPCETPSLSKSIIHTLLTQSPAHAYAAHPRLNQDFERVEEQKYDVGNIAHALLLQGLETVHLVNAPDWRTNAAKEERDLARQHGRTPLLTHQMADVRRMVDAVREQLAHFDATPPLFIDGKPEQTMVWEEDGVTCRALVDWLHDDMSTIDDLKTTSRSANPATWRSTLYGMGADLQVAFYRRGLKALTGLEPEFRFCVVETAPPFAVSVIALAPDALALADSKVEWAINKWRTCVATDTWPCYPQQVCYVQAPGWEESRWLEFETREELAA